MRSIYFEISMVKLEFMTCFVSGKIQFGPCIGCTTVDIRTCWDNPISN